MDGHEASQINALAKSLYEHKLAASMEDACEMATRMLGEEHVPTPKMTEKMEHYMDYAKDHKEEALASAQEVESQIVEGDAASLLAQVSIAQSQEEQHEEKEEEPEVHEAALDPSLLAEFSPPTVEEDVVHSFHELEMESEGEEIKVEESPEPEQKEDEIIITEEDEESRLEGLIVSHEVEEEEEDGDAVEEAYEDIKEASGAASEHIQELKKEIAGFKRDLEANTKELVELKQFLHELQELVKSGEGAQRAEEAGVEIAEIAEGKDLNN